VRGANGRKAARVRQAQRLDTPVGYPTGVFSFVRPMLALARSGAVLQRQRLAFLRGDSPPDFPADHFEVEFDGRGGEGDLTTVGREQMGFEPAA